MSAKEQIRNFIQTDILHESLELSDDLDVIENNIVNSLGVLQIVAFMEQSFQIVIEKQHITYQHFKDIDSMYRLLQLYKNEQ
jgi:acyl carrier protein